MFEHIEYELGYFGSMSPIIGSDTTPILYMGIAKTVIDTVFLLLLSS